MRRRRFVQSMVGLPIVAVGLSGCNPFRRIAVQIYLLEDSVPSQVLQGFQKVSQHKSVGFHDETTLRQLYNRLVGWQAGDPQPLNLWQRLPLPSRQPVMNYGNLVTLGDAWLTPAIQRHLLTPLIPDSLQQWSQLGERWQQLVRRDRTGQLDANGEVWGIPYRWGSLQILYNRLHLDAEEVSLRSWSDLLNPALQRRLALPDDARLVGAIALKATGGDVNSPTSADVQRAQSFLQQLHKQVRFYSSDAYLQPLVLEDVTAVVGWSTDVLPVLQQYRQFAAIVPEEGTLLSADLWVQPARTDTTAPSTESTDLVQAWIDFCLTEDSALLLTIYSQGASPLYWGKASTTLPPPIQDRLLLTLSPDLADRSDFLLPLSVTTQSAYQQLLESLA